MAKNRITRFLGAGFVGVLTATALVGPAIAAPVANPGLDRKQLQRSLDDVRDAGMYGMYSAVQNGDQSWNGATGVADVKTRRPLKPNMEHRVGSITKMFTSAAILQQVERGRINLDRPIATYLPDLVPGERGQRITTRMLLNHTSGIADYFDRAFPSLAKLDPQSVLANRFRTFRPAELITFGLSAPPTGEPGQKHSYSNVNYILAGELIKRVTGTSAQKYVTDNVIARAGLKHTYIPPTAHLRGNHHPRMYDSFFGKLNPPRDFSVYDPSSYDMAGAIVSTMPDLTAFLRALFGGKIIAPTSLAQMTTTVPITDENGKVVGRYGLGISATQTACGTFWGHNGQVFGAGSVALISADRQRQLSMGVNLVNYGSIDQTNNPIDVAVREYQNVALCGKAAPDTTTTPPSTRPFSR